MSTTKSTIVLLFTIGLLAVIFFFRNYYTQSGRDAITVTKTEISRPSGFINPITIEKLKVDSLGREHRPVKYTIEYLATCSIKQQVGKPPVVLKTIKLNVPGYYVWSEENTTGTVVHEDGSGTMKKTDTIQNGNHTKGVHEYKTCPFSFVPGNWYLIDLMDPKITGIYIYVDNKGNLHQYITYS